MLVDAKASREIEVVTSRDWIYLVFSHIITVRGGLMIRYLHTFSFGRNISQVASI